MKGGLLAMQLACAACGSPAQQTASEAADAGEPGGSRLTVTTPPLTIAPGQEALKCYFTSLPSDDAIAVTELDSILGPGGHHAIVFVSSAPNQPDGTFTDCNILPSGGDTPNAIPVPIYLTQTLRDGISMPAGVALKLEARTPLMVEMHYVNDTEQPLDASVIIEATLARETTLESAGFFATYNQQIAIPPHGEQTVSGDCAPPQDAQFFRMTTHAHSRMTSATVSRSIGGQPGEQLVYSTDWNNPQTVTWTEPYLTFSADEKLHYACSYRNDGDIVIHEGQSVTKDEMCMAVGYYFPASGSTVCLDSSSVFLSGTSR